jgi:hypothetical protein
VKSAQQIPRSPDDPAASQKSLPLATCPFCGSTWFREVAVNRYLPPPAPAYPRDLHKQQLLSLTHPRRLVCLCGAPLRPVGVNRLIGGSAARMELRNFEKSLDGALAEIKSSRRDLDAAVERRVEDDQDDPFDAAAARLRRAEETVLWEQKKADPKELVGARKPWKKIDREPEAKTALGRDDLVLALQEKGFTYRMARLLVKEILDACLLALTRDSELKTPFGKFRLAAAPEQREHRAFGRSVKTYTHERWIRFRPAADLTIRALDDDDAGDNADVEDEAVLEEQEEDEMTQSGEDRPVKCPRCKSTWMMAAEFRQYMEASGSTPGADIFPLDATVFPLRVCLCGQPIGPTLKNAYRDVPGLEDFLENVKKARRYLKRAGAVEEAVERILLEFVPREKLERLLARLSNVEAGINALRPDPTDAF